MPDPAIFLPAVIGHRGARGIAPENTLAAMEAAAALGLGWVEIDIRLSADGICVLCHDATLKRVTGRRLRLSRLTARQLSGIFPGGKKTGTEGDCSRTIPDLDRALRTARRLGLGLDIELKNCGTRNRQLVRAAAELIAPACSGGDVPVLVTSFRASLLAAFTRAAPGIPVGLVMKKIRRGWRRRVERLGCVAVCCRAQALDAASVRSFRDAGLMVIAYNVNDAPTAEKLLQWGVISVISDNPSALSALVARRR